MADENNPKQKATDVFSIACKQLAARLAGLVGEPVSRLSPAKALEVGLDLGMQINALAIIAASKGKTLPSEEWMAEEILNRIALEREHGP